MSGNSRPSRPVAELAAIRRWIERVSEDDAAYSVWHRAREKVMDCQRTGKAGYHRCYVTATPCTASAGAGEPAAGGGHTGSVRN